MALTAFSAIGQFSDTVTPLQEAMFAAAIANNGTLMKPYLVQQVTASDLSTVQSTPQSVLSQPVSPSVANSVGQMMRAVVQDPDGTAAAFNAQAEGGLVIAGKTGTAETGVVIGLNDAAFTSFAPYGNPRYRRRRHNSRRRLRRLCRRTHRCAGHQGVPDRPWGIRERLSAGRPLQADRPHSGRRHG